jgi:hypothetical protein
VQVISLGGVVNAHPAIDRIDALYHLYGRKDGWQRVVVTLESGSRQR